MTDERAKELFSEYREGTLSAPLTASLEQKFQSNPELKAEYVSFSEVLKALDGEQVYSVDLPHDLHDRIMAKVDKSIWDAKQNQKSSWWSSWRLILVGGMACLAIFGTVNSLKNTQNHAAVESGLGSVQSESNMFDLTLVDGKVHLIMPNSKMVLVVKNDQTGDLVDRFDLKGKSLNSPLLNNQESSVLLSIQSDNQVSFVSLPGSIRSSETKGKGTLKDLAVAISNLTGKPACFESTDLTSNFDWTLDVNEISRSKINQGELSIDIRRGIIHLSR